MNSFGITGKNSLKISKGIPSEIPGGISLEVARGMHSEIFKGIN